MWESKNKEEEKPFWLLLEAAMHEYEVLATLFS